MKRPTPLFFISVGLVSLTLSILLMSDLAVNLTPDSTTEIFEYRRQLSEGLAIQFSLFGEARNEAAIAEGLHLLVERYDEILSGALTLRTGDVLVQAGPHEQLWQPPPGLASTVDHIQVPIFYQEGVWGTVQLRFRSLPDKNWEYWIIHPWVRFLALVMGSAFLGYYLYMKRTLKQLDPSSVVPVRVKAAFDVLKEGVVLLDTQEHIVLANRAFGQIVGWSPEELLGKSLRAFRWRTPDSELELTTFPWQSSLDHQRMELDFPVMLKVGEGSFLKFLVNCTPIFGDSEQVRGVLVSFADVTQLHETIQELEASKSQLEKLAMRDPLTGCFNRRALFDAFEDQWTVCQSQEQDLGCIMTDIDHFKSFNDRFGHAVGDQVIQVVANILQQEIRPGDILGRYGGEEFCILMPGNTPEQTVLAAERLRTAIEDKASRTIRTTSGTKITMSFGVSAFSVGASDPLDLVDQADKGLYAAKQGGRNQVGVWMSTGAKTVEAPKEEFTTAGFS